MHKVETQGVDDRHSRIIISFIVCCFNSKELSRLGYYYSAPVHRTATLAHQSSRIHSAKMCAPSSCSARREEPQKHDPTRQTRRRPGQASVQHPITMPERSISRDITTKNDRAPPPMPRKPDTMDKSVRLVGTQEKGRENKKPPRQPRLKKEKKEKKTRIAVVAGPEAACFMRDRAPSGALAPRPRMSCPAVSNSGPGRPTTPG